MTPAPLMAELWYGPLKIESISRILGIPETWVRIEAVMVHRLGPRTPHINPHENPDRRKEFRFGVY
jgi:hypothetical protein